ncbi:MAG: DNA gyrase, A subunit [Candidatus Xenolissoclinum pacificiensis L6]|uniref:DNA topoisomerase (ATP-hydrolyzing) n=1 Tax=Candidatus Xenolissoclinum pacificiensis L6 TaxID=1401685 RepID=W2UZT7_9RICK|nr:MAG: DNA gyrase, A subunit [Candidatus Xenolissoclinum pacificiensis L6]
MSSVVKVVLEKELEKSYLSYAMSVIINRAIPDVRDGLKPVHRRILYAMYSVANPYKIYRKSSRVVGDTVGKYHPHGDVAIYDALVRMAQKFSLREPLIDGQGNFGSVDGDQPAAMRYTEVRLSEITRFLVSDLSQNTVDFQSNYDGLESEPSVLPAGFPNILVNGVNGVAVGMATNIPCHNLAEVIDAVVLLLQSPDSTVHDLMKCLPGPDFPTGATIMGMYGIVSAYTTGKGTITLRSNTHFEEKNNRKYIIVDELPYQVNKSRLIESMASLIRDKVIDGISAIVDESDRHGIRVVIELKKGYEQEFVLNQLFTITNLQIRYSINMMVLNRNKPSLMNLKDVLATFLEYRFSVVIRRITFRLEKAQNKSNILISLYIALLDIDAVIKIVKDSGDRDEAIFLLKDYVWNIEDDEIKGYIYIITNIPVIENKYSLTTSQAEAILNIRLQTLTKLEKNRILDELKCHIAIIEECNMLLSSQEKLTELIRDELLQIKTQHCTPRRTIIEQSGDEGVLDDEDLILKEDMVVTFTNMGYIKRVKLSHYRSQKRGGKGRLGQDIKNEDFTEKIFVVDTHTEILFFSTKAKVYKLKTYLLPLSEPASRGRALVNSLNLEDGECINTIMPVTKDISADSSMVFITSHGKVKRNKFSDFHYIPSNGKLALSLSDDDMLVAVMLATSQHDVFVATYYGKSIRFPIEDIRLFKGRVAGGVRGIKLSENDRVVGSSVLSGLEFDVNTRDEYLRIPISKRRILALQDDISTKSDLGNLSMDIVLRYAKNEQFILSVTENGYGKITSAYEYRSVNRGGAGIVNVATTKRNGYVVASFPIEQDSHIILVTNKGQLIRIKTSDISISGRSSQGVILLKTKKDERVVSVAQISNMQKEDDISEE